MYPEHEKLKSIKGLSQELGSFIEWAKGKGWTLRKWHEEDDYTGYISVGKSIQEMLAEFYNIDLVKLEEEKEDLLKQIRGNV